MIDLASVGRYPREHVDVAAWQRGDRPTLAAAVAEALPRVWWLARSGYLLSGPPALHILGIDDSDRAERLVALALADVLTPQLRAQHAPDQPQWPQLVLTQARAALEAHAQAHGGAVTVSPDAELPALPMIDAPAAKVPDAPSALGIEARARAEALATHAADMALDATDRAIVERRWRAGESREVVAQALGISPPRVAARERVIVRHLRHHAIELGHHLGEADLDAALAGETTEHALTLRTRERLIHAVLTRVDPTPPRSQAVRTAWAVGALALGLGLGALVYLDVLPGAEDDPTLEPAVVIECEGPCRAGQAARVRVTAPRGAQRVAISIVNAAGEPQAWLADPMGRSLPLPSSARWRDARLSRTLTLPAAPGSLRAVAVFSKKRLDRAALTRATAGDVPEGSYAAWSTLELE